MSINSALGRLVGRRRRPPRRTYVTIGDSYRIEASRRPYGGKSNWIHTHH